MCYEQFSLIEFIYLFYKRKSLSEAKPFKTVKKQTKKTYYLKRGINKYKYFFFLFF